MSDARDILVRAMGSEATALSAAKLVAMRALGAVPFITPDSLPSYITLIEAFIRRNLTLIHAHSRHESERAFLASLLLEHLQKDPPGIVFASPQSADDALRQRRDPACISNGGGADSTWVNAQALQRLVADVGSGSWLEVGDRSLGESFLASFGPGLEHKWHAAIHPEFLGLRDAHGLFVVDLLLWVPADSRKTVLVAFGDPGPPIARDESPAVAPDRRLRFESCTMIRYRADEDPISAGLNLSWRLLLER
jgi:hypothetical protein